MIKCVLPEKRRKITIHQLNIQIEWQLETYQTETSNKQEKTFCSMKNKNDSEKCINDDQMNYLQYDVKCSNKKFHFGDNVLHLFGSIWFYHWQYMHEHLMNRAQILSLKLLTRPVRINRISLFCFRFHFLSDSGESSWIVWNQLRWDLQINDFLWTNFVFVILT